MSAPHIPGIQLLADVRAGFVQQQSSLNRWCKKNKVTASWARQALVGKRKGRAADALRKRITKAALKADAARPPKPTEGDA